jgi:hypothetical protein
MDRYDIFYGKEIYANTMTKVHWTERHSTAKMIRWEFELKRINFTLSQRRRESLLNELEKQNNDIQNLLGNSDRLEPMRRKRKSTIPKFFQRIRNQAYSLHSALGGAWKCDCSESHATKLLLEKRVVKDKIGWVDSNDSVAVKFILFFCPDPEPNAQWYATEIVVAEPSVCLGHKSPQRTESGRRSSSATYTGSRLDINAMSQGPSTGSAKYSRRSDSGSRSVSFLGSSTGSTLSAPSEGFEIIDLCSTLKQLPKAPQFLGFLKDKTDQYFAISIETERKLSPVDTASVLTLESLLIMTAATERKGTVSDIAIPRRARLKIAVTLANSVLQLHSGPWLPEIWTKRDIYFFRNSDGVINTNHPLVLNHFQSRPDGTSKPVLSPIGFKTQRSHSGNPCLLSLGIVILELWFNQTLESQPFRKDFLGPDGKENEYTNFNTALKWQEMTMEEAGPDLYNPTRRCVYCAFGAASQDLEDDELRKAVFDEVVQPLERLLERFEGGLVD